MVSGWKLQYGANYKLNRETGLELDALPSSPACRSN